MVRYLAWISGIFVGNFGTSYSYGVPVAELIRDRLTVTVPLTLMAITWSLTMPPKATGFAHFSAGDFIRVGIGILICIGMTLELIRQPRDVEGYRTWVYIGAGVAFVWLVFAALKWAFP